MEYSFTSRLLSVYFDLSRNGGKSRFKAYCILLRSIRFVPNEEFVERLLGDITKQRQVHKNLLLGRPIRDTISKKFDLKSSDIEFIVEGLLYLNTRFSTSLMHSLCNYIDSPRLEKYLKDLFHAYFNVLKSGKISEFNKRSVFNKLIYLKNNIPTPYLKNNIPTPQNQDRRVLNYGPRMTTNSGVWGEALPRYIKSIPMGGRNKKY